MQVDFNLYRGGLREDEGSSAWAQKETEQLYLCVESLPLKDLNHNDDYIDDKDDHGDDS